MHFTRMIGTRQIGYADRMPQKQHFASTATHLALRDLKCSQADVFPPVQPSYDESYPNYVPTMASKFSTAVGQERFLALVNEDGELHLMDTDRQGKDAMILKLPVHSNAAFDCCWMNATPNHLVTVSGDTTAALWDLSVSRKLADFRGHTSSIKTVDVRPNDQSVFATGSRDSNILVWDVRTRQKCDQHHQPVNRIRHAHCLSKSSVGKPKRPKKNAAAAAAYDPLQSVTAVVFQDDNTLISSGTADGAIKAWDLRKTYCNYKNEPVPKWVLPYAGRSVKKHGYSSITMDSGRNRLFANCTDSVIYEFNCASCEPRPINVYQGHQNSTFFVKLALCPEDNFLVSGSSDSNAYIWRVGQPSSPVYQLTGHFSEVTTVDYCRQRGAPKLVTCADDMKTMIWRVAPNLPVERTAGRIETMPQPPGIAHFSLIVRSATYSNRHAQSPTGKATPIKILGTSVLGHSPTVNLPNSITDSSPDTCSPRATPRRQRRENWLTTLASISSDSKRRKEESLPNTPVGSGNKRRKQETLPDTPVGSGKTATLITPTGSGKGPMQRRRLRNCSSRNSLEKYFRPTRL